MLRSGLHQLADMLDKAADYGRDNKGKGSKNPGQELFWGGYIDGLRDAAVMTRETAARIAH